MYVLSRASCAISVTYDFNFGVCHLDAADTQSPLPQGQLPLDLVGTYYRNGPGLFEVRLHLLV